MLAARATLLAVVALCRFGVFACQQSAGVHCFLSSPEGGQSSQEQHCKNVRSNLFWCILAAAVVVSAGVAPALLLPSDADDSCSASPSNNKRQVVTGRILNRLLSFAVGTLLGDTFLHLLPYLWNASISVKRIDLRIIIGLLICICIEKCAHNDRRSMSVLTVVINLIANVVDNFCHGLAIGTSFMISVRLGLFTTFAILLHEVPHEIGDFALLLRARFSRRSAVRAQLLTASFGVTGSITAVLMQNVNELNDGVSFWVLPFCTAAFLNVALIQVLPDILEDRDVKESILHVLLVLTGIGVTGCLSVIDF